MEPKKENKSMQEWTKKLLSGDEALIKKTIKELREKGSPEIITVLGTLLHNSPSEEITVTVINFFRDLKNKESVSNLVEVISKSKDLEMFPSIVACAWENGLDYSEHIEFFISLVLEEDLYAAIEAFTVIEENAEKLNAEKRNNLLKDITLKSKTESKEKAKLIEELISIMSIVPGPLSLDEPE